MSVKGKIIVITGAGRGIGRALALGLAAQGAKLALCSRTMSEITAVAAQCVQSPASAEAVFAGACDIADRKQVDAWVGQVVERFGAIDVLVNNAGILGPRLPLAEYPARDWEAVIRVNLTGVFHMTQSVLHQAMEPRKQGTVINISSGVGRVGKPRWGAYAVSKFGVEGMTQILAAELKEKGVKVFALNPEGTRTGMRAEAYPEEDPQSLKAPDALTDAVLCLITMGPEDSGKSFNWSDLVPLRNDGK